MHFPLGLLALQAATRRGWGSCTMGDRLCVHVCVFLFPVHGLDVAGALGVAGKHLARVCPVVADALHAQAAVECVDLGRDVVVERVKQRLHDCVAVPALAADDLC